MLYCQPDYIIYFLFKSKDCFFVLSKLFFTSFVEIRVFLLGTKQFIICYKQPFLIRVEKQLLFSKVSIVKFHTYNVLIMFHTLYNGYEAIVVFNFTINLSTWKSISLFLRLEFKNIIYFLVHNLKISLYKLSFHSISCKVFHFSFALFYLLIKKIEVGRERPDGWRQDCTKPHSDNAALLLLLRLISSYRVCA